MAVIVGALIIHGVSSDPEQPRHLLGTIASMYIGNIMLLVLNLPLIGLWVKVLKIPYGILFPLILFFCFVGAYSGNNSLVGPQGEGEEAP
jgi:putative tricarboxylic transport membrane protein